MTITALLEPTVIMTFVTHSLATASGTTGGMVGAGTTLSQAPYLALTLIALGLIALAENARYPVDNPATHLELTMVHEAMVLEYSGPYLAMLEMASYVKLTIFSLFIANMLFPIGLVGSAGGFIAVFAAIGASILKLTVVMALLALLESTIAKMRFYRMQEYLTSAFFLALSGLVLALIQRAI
jgi:formate hydrogenlyase subunit 4